MKKSFSMTVFPRNAARLLIFPVLAGLIAAAWPRKAAEYNTLEADQAIEWGKQLYLNGIKPDGAPMLGFAQGDLPMAGRQAACAKCHRKSALGANEGNEVVPALRGEILFQPLRLPTHKPPLAPILRPAYAEASLHLAIRDGVNSAGESLSPVMPRYRLSDQEIDYLTAYLKNLKMAPDPGVTDTEIHLATVLGQSTPPETRAAMIAVFDTFVTQKNSESRHESKRSAHAPWHKAWQYEAYRKWILHVWELAGDENTWDEQLERQYRQHPVFALIGGAVFGDWRPVHEFCQRRQLPCLFPITQQPVIAEQDFYSIYLDKGLTFQAEVVARHLVEERAPVIQIVSRADSLGQQAAVTLRNQLLPEHEVRNIMLEGKADWSSIMTQSIDSVVIPWLGRNDLTDFWSALAGSRQRPHRIYLSTSLFGTALDSIPLAVRERVYFVHPYALPADLPKLLRRSNGWLRAKKSYSAGQEGIQADSYLALTLTGMALKRIRGYFNRDYFLEGFEHLVDNAIFTSRYPRISLAPGQRFIAKGGYILKPAGDGKDELRSVTGWLLSDSN